MVVGICCCFARRGVVPQVECLVGVVVVVAAVVVVPLLAVVADHAMVWYPRKLRCERCCSRGGCGGCVFVLGFVCRQLAWVWMGLGSSSVVLRVTSLRRCRLRRGVLLVWYRWWDSVPLLLYSAMLAKAGVVVFPSGFVGVVGAAEGRLATGGAVRMARMSSGQAGLRNHQEEPMHVGERCPSSHDPDGEEVPLAPLAHMSRPSKCRLRPVIGRGRTVSSQHP